MPRTYGALKGAELVAVDADGLALDPDLRPSWGLGAPVTDAATQTRRGRVVGLDGWTTGKPDLHCSALWIEWADTGEREHLADLSGLLHRGGHRAAHSSGLIPAWEAVYAERRAARAALLDESGPGGPGPVARRAWLDAAPFRVTDEQWSPDVDTYASGAISVAALRCVLCGTAPCACRPCPACDWSAVAPGADCPRGCGTR